MSDYLYLTPTGRRPVRLTTRFRGVRLIYPVSGAVLGGDDFSSFDAEACLAACRVHVNGVAIAEVFGRIAEGGALTIFGI